MRRWIVRRAEEIDLSTVTRSVSEGRATCRTRSLAPASVQLSTAPQSSPSSVLQSSADDATYPAQVDAVYQSLAYDALPQSTTEKKSTVKPKKVAATESLDAVLAANDPWDIF